FSPKAYMSAAMTTVNTAIPKASSVSVRLPRTTPGLPGSPVSSLAIANAPPLTEKRRLVAAMLAVLVEIGSFLECELRRRQPSRYLEFSWCARKVLDIFNQHEANGRRHGASLVAT